MLTRTHIRRSRSRRALLGVVVAAALGLGVMPGAAAAPEAAAHGQDTPAGDRWEAKVSPEVLDNLETEQDADFLVELDERADLHKATEIKDWDRRGEYVVDELRKTAAASQRKLRALLDQADADYQPYWAVNAILVRGASAELTRKVAVEGAVSRLHAVAAYDPPELLPADAAEQAAAVEWGVAAINADDVWTDFGVRGEGVVVANIDTGVRYDHPALVDRYRGTKPDGTFDHAYNWFDPAGICGEPADGPCDNQSHGTHTMGTMIGDDSGGAAIGAAPDARWIAAKGCEAVGQIGCSVDALIASGQWMLAPTDLDGDNPRPDLRPHIINNSWGADTGPATDPFYDQLVDVWNAAGIFAVFSNGNDGARGCDTAGSPADALGAYAVGAHDVEDQIAPFSSRGPGEDGQLRPHLAAPGVAVRSSVPSGYAVANGTSMAAPHASAAVALMWSAAPSLIGDVMGTRELVNQTAVDTTDLTCGGTPENNNVFGEGRLDALAAVSASPVGATGTLTGVVTDEATGEPVPRATVHAVSAGYERTTTTDADGQYVLALTTGAYDVSVRAYGYVDTTSRGAAVVEDTTTTHDIPLTARPSVTVSGTVTDGSGHGWPMYAGITVEGYPHGTIYTNPYTGHYEVVLPAATTYSVNVVGEYAGYNALADDIVVGSGNFTADFELTANTDECIAPGYRSANAGLFEAFDSGTLPAGWTLDSTRGDGWEMDNPGGRDNMTGGTSGFASIDSTEGARLEDGWLISPTIDLSESATPIISFRTDLILSRGVAEIDVSTDDGASWANVWRRATHLRGPHLEQVDVPSAAGDSDVRVRLHYRNDTSHNGFWQVDELLVGHRACEPLPGGLVAGRVSNDRTDVDVDGASVQSVALPAERATSAGTPGDPELAGGFYWMFSSHTGSTDLRAEHQLGQYSSVTQSVDVAQSKLVRADFALGTGELKVETATVDRTLELGDSTQATVTVTNVGSAPASFDLAERSSAPDAADRSVLEQPGAPLRRAVVDDDGGPLGSSTNRAGQGLKGADPTAEWQRLHDMPDARTDGLADVHDGKIYYIGSGTGLGQLNMIYDIAEDRWDWTESRLDSRGKAAGGFIGDRMYVVGGWGPAGAGELATTMIYDPTADSWSQGADAPIAVAAAGHAIVEDRLYVIGGRARGHSDQGSSAVMVYDAAADSWSRAADYPEPASWQSCGTIDGLIYCAGGQGPGVEHVARSYVYNPDTDVWHRIADLPRTVTTSSVSAANGLLLVSGGRVGGYRSNEGFYYDPAANTWSSLPNSIFDVFRLAGACGFYKMGGSQGQPGTFPWVEQLPGFDDCDRSASDRVPWLSADPTTTTLEPGQSTEVTVTMDAAVDQPGEQKGTILIHEDTPFDNASIAVAMDVTPPKSWGEVTGTVNGLARCDQSGKPLADATVHITGNSADVEVSTDEHGRYSYWLDKSEKRVAVRAARDGWVERSRLVKVKAGRAVTADFTLRRDEPCAAADPGELSLTVQAGRQTAEPLTLRNDGAVPFDYHVAETEHALEPIPGTAPRTQAAEWSEGPEIPEGRAEYARAQCPEDPDLAYVIGGFDERIEYDRKVWRYDAAANTWHELARVPASGSGAVATCEAGKIHVLGGGGTDRHYVYDVARNSWSEAAPLPQALSGAAAAAWDGKIYLAGGTADGGWFDTLDRVDVYDIESDSWSNGPPMPVAAKSSGHVQAGQYLYVVGGLDENADEPMLSTVQRLDLVSGTWSLGPELEHARSDLGLTATTAALYAIGGNGVHDFGRAPTTTVQRLALDQWDGGAWGADATAELPAPTAHSQAGFCTQARAGGEIWSVGGGDPRCTGRCSCRWPASSVPRC